MFLSLRSSFLEEDSSGTTPKFDVEDAQGTKWKVKLGEEARPETAASRFVWAAGYITYDYYLLPSMTVQNLPLKLKRGENLRLEGGTFSDVRVKKAPKGFTKDGDWKWKDNPFKGTRDFNGLRTLMALMNNWDLKDENTAILQSEEGTKAYLVQCTVSPFYYRGGISVALPCWGGQSDIPLWLR